jgi:hypothetical protein
MGIDTILLILAAVLFALAALNVDISGGRVSLGWAGLFCWVLTGLV